MSPTGPAHGPPASEPLLRVVAIALGGALGTLARYGTDRALVPRPSGVPWATFTVNVAGSLLLGLIVTLVVERWPPTRFIRPFAAIGFCGGFTTFSTLAVETAQRAQHGRVGLAAGYVAASLVAGVVAAFVGMALARGRLFPLPGQRRFVPDPDDLGGLDPHAAEPGRGGETPS